MKIRSLIVLMITSFLLFGCDPALMLMVEAEKAEDTSVTIYADKTFFPDRIHLPYEKENKDEKTIIRVPWTDSIKNYKRNFSYGIGIWSDELVSNLSEHIDSIILKNSSGILKINKKTDIETYLLKNRRGFPIKKLIIKAE
ncbi:hypothetical protein GTQ40_12050 [Flavobacteriaceae bacterium R38]|nr:hypothetical protein [Flavobacteriaceae bacterium R38]